MDPAEFQKYSGKCQKCQNHILYHKTRLFAELRSQDFYYCLQYSNTGNRTKITLYVNTEITWLIIIIFENFIRISRLRFEPGLINLDSRRLRPLGHFALKLAANFQTSTVSFVYGGDTLR